MKTHTLLTVSLNDLGERVGQAFCNEREGIVTLLPIEEAIKAFKIMTEYYYRVGVLYATSENHEGLLAYWHKKDKMPLKPLLHMVFRMLKEMRFKSLWKLARNSQNLYEKIYKKEKDYVLVSMVVVFPRYQGKGYLRKILTRPFEEAKSCKIPCVLDTDTELKMKKYASCGMKVAGKKELKSGCSLYTMEYR